MQMHTTYNTKAGMKDTLLGMVLGITQSNGQATMPEPEPSTGNTQTNGQDTSSDTMPPSMRDNGKDLTMLNGPRLIIKYGKKVLLDTVNRLVPDTNNMLEAEDTPGSMLDSERTPMGGLDHIR